MKILLVSMRSIHAIRWVSQLMGSGHEIFYFDILNGGYVKEWNWITQFTDWRYKLGDFKGRYFIKKNFPKLHHLLENNVENEFERILKKIKPDVVHSFALHIACYPIVNIMNKYPKLPWIYSSWGNDLYFHQHKPEHQDEIRKVLPRIDYLFADCKRDLKLAKHLGFKGEILGDFPGGGGYDLNMIKENIKEVFEREYILIKGYHGELHRGLQVLKAIELIDKLPKLIIFSADDEVYNYYKSSENLLAKNIQIYKVKDPIPHQEFCRMMNNSVIYIGNNLTDGIPNTLLEAICFGAFPIQSNPGGATAEIIEDGTNGLLIDDCENVIKIKSKIEQALNNKELLKKAFLYNMELRKQLEYDYIREKVLKKYVVVENDILSSKII